MKNNFMTTLSRKANTVLFNLKKSSPEILMIVGVAGFAVTVVKACKATIKAEEIINEAKETMDKIHECEENEDLSEEEYSEKQAAEDKTTLMMQTGVKLAKLYAPAIIIGTASVACFVGSHNILSKRNVALAAAYATIDKSYKDYRGRVVERFGEGLDKELKYNIKAEKIKEKVVDENGKEKEIVRTVNSVKASDLGDYARIYDSGCVGWEKDPETNMMFLKAQEQYANDLLRSRGHLFLNEVYDMLGFERTKAGQVVGWVYKYDNAEGDNYVDFGIFNLNDEANRRFVNGLEPSIILDFNCDGNIMDRIWSK